jgi:hypothetical protein
LLEANSYQGSYGYSSGGRQGINGAWNESILLTNVPSTAGQGGSGTYNSSGYNGAIVLCY